MSVKHWGLILLAVFFLLGGFWLFQESALVWRGFSAQSQPINKEKTLKSESRDLELGQPQFLSDDSKDLTPLKKCQRQWALKDMRVFEAWKALDWELLKKREKEKKPIVVAVIDTGINTKHPCLKNGLWSNPGEIPNNGKDDDQNGYVDDVHGWNFVDNNSDIRDYHGHGTHISGIIAANPENPECKICGGAFNIVRIMTLKYFDEGEKSGNNVQNTVKSINYAVQNGADIINYSGGGPGANLDEKTAIAKAADKDIIFVAALGNEGSKIGRTKYYPASYKFPNILFVLSNYGPEIIESSNFVQTKHLEKKPQMQNAPGKDIISALPPESYFQSARKLKRQRQLAGYRVNYNRYGHLTGTSQATAFATSALALVKRKYPLYSMEQQIKQVYKTGFVQGTEKIKELTNEGKKLSAYEALIMRDKNIDLSDQIDQTNTAIPHDPKKVDKALKDPRNLRRKAGAYSPAEQPADAPDTFQTLKEISSFNKKK